MPDLGSAALPAAAPYPMAGRPGRPPPAARDPFPAVAAAGVASPIAVRETADSLEIEWPRWLRGALLGRWVAVIVLVVYASLFARMLGSSPYWGSISSVAEQVNYYQVARNFNRFGFTATAFLHDLSTASDPALHPFIYNHMPPGPEILTALLMRAVGENYRLIRLFFGLIFFAGLLCYLRFVRIVLGRLGLTGAGFTLIFLTPFWMLHAVDHPAYSPFPLLAFLPLLLLDRHYRTRRRLPLALAVLVVFVSSVYLVYQSLAMLVVSWIGLAFFRVLRFDRRHLTAFLAAVAAGIGLHAVQSAVFLGPALFAKETVLALSNRMLGVPTMQELKEFYRAVDVVHHGAYPLDLGAAGRTVLATLRIAEKGSTWWRIGDATVMVGLLLLVVAWAAGRLGPWSRGGDRPSPAPSPAAGSLTGAVRPLAGLCAWVAVTIVTPLLMFPAYSADYGLAGMGEFFLALAAVTVYAYMLAAWVRSHPAATRGARPAPLGPRVLAVAVLVAVVGGMYATASRWHYHTWATSVLLPESNPDPGRLLELGRRFHGTPLMTNAYPTLVGFFTEEAALGGCERQAFGAGGTVDPTECHLTLVRGFGRMPTVSPAYFVLFHNRHRTGFSRCDARCAEEFHALLAARYPLVEENALYALFDLSRRAAPAMGTR